MWTEIFHMYKLDLEKAEEPEIKLPTSTGWASLIAQLVKNPPAMQETPVQFLVRNICWKRDRLPTPVFLDFPCGKESAHNTGDLSSIPRLGRFPGEEKGYPLQNIWVIGGTSGKEPACQCRRHKRCGFDCWVEKIPWRRAWKPTPVFLPGESHGQRTLTGYSS